MKAVLCAIAVCVAGAVVIGQARWPSEGPPRPLPAHDVAFPPYEIRTLPNGLQVVAVLHHEQPAVSMRLIVRAGSSFEPKEKLGLAHLTAWLLDQGTTTKTAGEINDAIDFMGGEMGAGAATDLTFVSFIAMKDSFESGLAMLSDMTRHPAFAPEEIDRQRQRMLSSLQVSLEDPAFVANAVFDRLVYGFHPYGLPDSGTPATIGAISRDDIVEFHRKYYVPNNAILAIVGDVTAEEAFNSVTKVFGDWERKDVPKSNFITPPDPTRRLIVVNKPDAVQTEVRVGQTGVRRNHPDYMALNLAIRILGGEGANRLHQVLRTERGLTYGAEANMNALLEAGDFEAETNTRSEATGEVLRLMVDEFWRLQRERVSERELSDAKAYITGSFPLTIETPDAIATQVLNVLFFGLPVNDLQTFRTRVNAVTPDDVQRVARGYLRPDRLSIVLVGNAAAFQSQLKGLGFNAYELINMDELDLTRADFRRTPGRAAGRFGTRDPMSGSTPASVGAVGSRVPAGSPSRGFTSRQRFAYQSQSGIVSAEGAKARALLDKVITAKGGLERLRGIKTIIAVTDASRAAEGQNLTAETTTTLEYPNHVRVETKLPDARIVQVFDGRRGWVKDPNGVHEVPDQMIRELESGLQRDTIAMLLAAHDETVRTRILPDVKDETGRVHHALEISATNFDPVVLLIDPETSLINKQTYIAPAAGRPLIEELFGDYKTVDGVQIAFTATMRQAGRAVLARRVTRIQINAPIDPALFRRPSS